MIASRRNFNKTCGEKIKYKTHYQASRSLSRIIMQRGLYPGEKLNVYYCPYCLYWHIGHRKNKKKDSV